jgi:pyridoxine 5-phosphate synthase
MLKDIKIAKELNVNCVELHTGKISNLVKENKNYKNEYLKINKCSELGVKL